MANPEHLEILKQGVEAWNKWREENPGVETNVSGSDMELEDSKNFAKVAKKTALDIIGGAIKDIAKGQVKEAAKEIIELGRDLGPIIAKTAAYAFFKGTF